MNRAFQAAGDSLRTAVRPHTWPRLLGAAASLVLALACARPALSGPFIWDQDTNGIDDRMETVHLLGYSFSFEGADTLAHQRIEVVRQAGDLLFGAYVVFDHTPTNADLLTLTLLGAPVLARYEAIPAVRVLATWAQVAAAAQLTGVERLEAVPCFYPEVRDGAAAIAARDPSASVFPTWYGAGGADGSGVAVAILDTGINDAPDGTYPGHESLLGRFLGGAQFVHADSLLNTPRNGSENPVDRGGSVTQSHATHVAGIVLGSGGASGYALGVAPGARFVDVKVLDDTGVGVYIADGLDWCIHNRARAWGPAGYAGIQVINFSLSSTDATDGQDVASRLANAAVADGIVVVGSMGNAGKTSFVPSPAGANGAIAVGAMDAQRTPQESDDIWASFTNSGPRADDADGDPTNEQKPDLLAPGVSVLSADGDLSTDGTRYHRLSGTSMSAAFVSGAVAALLSGDPGMTPAQVADLLHRTARRTLTGAPAGVGGADTRWRSSLGFGIIDLYAARLERLQPDHSQVVRLGLVDGDTTLSATLLTQRERGTSVFAIERAPDLGGVPDVFAAYDSVAAAGDSSLAGAINRHVYPRTWTVPLPERGLAYWYRAAWTEDGIRRTSPAVLKVGPVGPPDATVYLTVVHDAYDHDVTGQVSTSGPGGSWSHPLPGSSAAVSSDWVNGTSTIGSVAWTFRIEVPPGVTGPPGSSQYWALRVDEGGYLNRAGRVTDYRVIWHGPSTDTEYPGGPLPLFTIEGQSVYASAPEATAGVDGSPGVAGGIHFAPNPVRAGTPVTFWLPAGSRPSLDVFDVSGRRAGRIALAESGDRLTGRWETRDAADAPIRPGIYLVRAGSGAPVRIAVIGP